MGKRHAERFQPGLFVEAPSPDDFSGQTVLIGLSGGINSAALLVYLGVVHPPEKRPERLLLFYAHLTEHSPDTFRFVAACVRWARRAFGAQRVRFGMSRASALDYFEGMRFIPHPTDSPCTAALKLEPMATWAEAQGGYDRDLVGYVRDERRRIKRQQERLGKQDAKRGTETAAAKGYAIAHLTNADCFALVDAHIGWHPAIYDLRLPNGRPAFANNNCLPCKNQHVYQLGYVRDFYPDYWEKAEAMAERIGRYWGRASEYDADPCAVCVFD